MVKATRVNRPTRRARFAPHPDDVAAIRDALEDAASGKAVTVDARAYVRWLRTGEGRGPWNDGSV